MNRLFTIISIGAFAAAALVLVQCDEITGGPPLNVRIEARTDSMVRISWAAPVEGTPDVYMVYFEEVGSPSYTGIGETEQIEYVDYPQGITGKYKVMARFGSETYDAVDKPTTVPIENSMAGLAELDAPGNSGYGWNRSSGEDSTYSMEEAGSADVVDFYITDFAVGYSGPTYSVASPDRGPIDPSGVVPPAAWRVTRFVDVSPYEHGPLPSYDQQTYFEFRDINQTPMIIGCYTEDEYYAMVRIDSIDIGTGEVKLTSWFQLVQGLRLIKH